MTYFNSLGRRIPSEGMRVFDETPSLFYSLKPQMNDYCEVFTRLHTYGLAGSISQVAFKNRAEQVLETIRLDPNYSSLLRGPSIPFVASSRQPITDLGAHLEKELLRSLGMSFETAYPDFHFKSVIQGDSSLEKKITLDEHSRYDDLLNAADNGSAVGWYFPQALQEFDVDSQRRQMTELPQLSGASVCLSGGLDVVAAMVGSPGLLVNEEQYPPILCLSAYRHVDPRLVLILKAYGPHLEFWCMTQMLTKTVTQVSEQWAGGLTIFN